VRDHRHALGEQQRGEQVALLAGAQCQDLRILALAFGAAVPGLVVVGAGEPGGEFGQGGLGATPKVSDSVAVAAVPLGPGCPCRSGRRGSRSGSRTGTRRRRSGRRSPWRTGPAAASPDYTGTLDQVRRARRPGSSDAGPKPTPGRYPCHTNPSISVRATHSCDPSGAISASSTCSAASANSEKLVPEPSYAAPSGYERPGLIFTAQAPAGHKQRIRAGQAGGQVEGRARRCP
jgi:hypothetical protein